MNASILTYRIKILKPGAFEELEFVRLLRAVSTDDGVDVREGTCGTVVGVWADGAAYEVEFTAGLATVQAVDLEAAPTSE